MKYWVARVDELMLVSRPLALHELGEGDALQAGEGVRRRVHRHVGARPGGWRVGPCLVSYDVSHPCLRGVLGGVVLLAPLGICGLLGAPGGGQGEPGDSE